MNKSFSLIIVILCMLFSCNELPDKPVRDNIFDTNASFDDEPPIAHISVSQDTGFINETYFEFSAKSSIEEEHPDAVLYYKWDLNNDGIWDTELSSNENIKVIYSDSDHSISNSIKLYEPGELTIKLFVLGALNKSTTISYTIYVYDHPKIVLDWKVDLFSSRFYFDASGSADWTGDENLEMRWDFNNDNIWDTDWNNNKLINYLIDDSYGNTWGTKLEVKDRFNFTSEILTEQYRPDISGLVAYFPFSGNCLDSSGNNLNGTNYGATPAEDRFGNPERALYFNGSNDYIDLGKNEKLKPSDYISISTWIKLEEAGGIFTNNDSCDQNYGFNWSASRVTAGSGKDNIYITIGTSYNGWKHIVLTYSKDRLWCDHIFLYINGHKGGYDSVCRHIPNIVYKNSSSVIGKICNNYFKGTLDEIYIFNRALSIEDVKNLYHSRE